MMRKLLLFMMVLSLFILPSLAEPLVLLEDFAEDISEQYDEEDPSYGTFVYSCRYPRVDDSGEGGAEINAFYDYQLNDTVSNFVPMLQEAYEGFDSSMVVTYQVTCNTDEYFSVLVRTEKTNPDQSLVYWTGNTFSRIYPSADHTYSLPKILGILAPDDNEEWLQDYQTEKVNNLIRQMVWEMIEDGSSGLTKESGITEENLAHIFFPEEEYYLDEKGNPVFYLQPSDVYDEVPEGTELFIFPISLEIILDEL